MSPSNRPPEPWHSFFKELEDCGDRLYPSLGKSRYGPSPPPPISPIFRSRPVPSSETSETLHFENRAEARDSEEERLCCLSAFAARRELPCIGLSVLPAGESP
jgi:hypothetical protein